MLLIVACRPSVLKLEGVPSIPLAFWLFDIVPKLYSTTNTYPGKKKITWLARRQSLEHDLCEQSES